MRRIFTVVIPVYRVEAYLQKCLDSVENQTFANWECICVDDGSPDGCGSILDSYAEKDNRFIVKHQKNAGVSVARNTALNIAQGEWIQFLDADDSLELDFLEKIFKDTLAHPEVDAVEHTAIYCYEYGRREYGCNGQLPPKGVFNAQDILSDPCGHKYTCLARCACYKIFRRSIITANNLRFTPNITLGEDTLFAIQFYAHADKVFINPETAGYLRIFREGSAMKSISAKMLTGNIMICNALYDTYRHRPSNGLSVTLTSKIIGLLSLGNDYPEKIRVACQDAVLSSRFFTHSAMRHLFLHGTYKMRLFAIVYRFMPMRVRRSILNRLYRNSHHKGGQS